MQHDAAVTSDLASEVSHLHEDAARTSLLHALALFLGLFALVVVLQVRNGAYRTAFEGFADEPSHYVTGVLFRDYARSGFSTPPKQYAQAFYEQYPKVGLGHWPPLFYLVEGSWMLVFGVERVPLLILMALLAAMLATAAGLVLKRWYGMAAGIAGGVIVVLAPEYQRQASMIMLEILLALFGFLATIAFGRYMERERWRDSLLFGLFAGLCILTKSNGWALALVPPIALLLGRRLNLLARASLWVPSLAAAAAGLAWHVFSLSYIRHVWEPESRTNPILFYIRHIVPVAEGVVFCCGLGMFVLACAGLAWKVVIPAFTSRGVQGERAALAALLAATCAFTIITPLGVELRKMLMVIMPVAMFAVEGAWQLRKLPSRYQWAVLPVVAAFALYPAVVPQMKQNSGIVAAVGTILDTSREPVRFLVSGTASQEGGLIAEILMHDNGRRHHVSRASKLFASSDWNGTSYSLRYETPEKIAEAMRRDGVTVVLRGVEAPGEEVPPHRPLLESALRANPAEWRLLTTPRPTSTSSAIETFVRAEGRAQSSGTSR